jgi:hypothetical protein
MPAIPPAKLDIDDLKQWAEQLSVVEYLDRALIQAGL